MKGEIKISEITAVEIAQILQMDSDSIEAILLRYQRFTPKIMARLEDDDEELKNKIQIQHKLRILLDVLESQVKQVKEVYDAAFKKYVPEAMEGEDVEKISIKGVGTVYLQGDMYVSVVTDKKEAAYQWLEDTGNGDIIKPTVNASSLSSLIKGLVKDGQPVPSKLFNITPYTKAVIKKN